MPSEAAKQAYARLLYDLDRRVFYRHPYEDKFVSSTRDDWLSELEAAADAAAYVADPSPQIDIPKVGWHTRPGLALSLRDQFVYHYVALKAVPVLLPLMEWSAASVRFSYRLARAGKTWFEKEFQGWRNFDKVSLGKISGGAKHVLVSDIAGYYENIDIGRLILELQAARVDKSACDQLSALWNKWCGVRGKGIPQGYSPSHVFGEFYLDPIDRALTSMGIDHVRYLDDIRVFSRSAVDARRALHELSRLLRDRGLNLQSAKTEILTAAKSRKAFSAVHASVRSVGRRIADELMRLAREGDYIHPDDIALVLRTDPDDPPPEVVERAWRSFVDGELAFNKTLFHYLLGRLAQIRSGGAVEWSVDLLQARPEETYHVLAHLTDVQDQVPAATLDRLAVLLGGDALLYDYQRYLILAWFHRLQLRHAGVTAVARRLSGANVTPLVRAHAIAYLGEHGEGIADTQRLERGLQNETSELMRATYLYALRRAPDPTRNHWYGRCLGESRLVDQAIGLGRRGD